MSEEQQTYEMSIHDRRAALLYKKSLLREDIVRENWSDDKFLKIGGGGFGYVTVDKLKRVLAPLFHRNGLELTVDFDQLEFRGSTNNNSQWWTVRAIISVIDIDTGEFDESYAYGEGSSNSEKGVSVAQAIALKQWFLHNYLLVDGIDADGTSDSGSYYKKSPEEQDEIKSKVLSKGIAPAGNDEVKKRVEELKKKRMGGAQTQTEPESNPSEKPAEKPAEKPVESVEDAKVEQPAEAPVEAKEDAPKDVSFIPNTLQKKTMDNIVKHYNDYAKNGKVSVEDYNQMSMDRASISCHKEAVEFIAKYKDILSGD